MTAWDVEDPAVGDDLFTRDVDEQPVQSVRPADTDRPTWSVYERGTYLGTVNADGGRPLWRVQTTREAHRDLADVIRALRRPTSRPSPDAPAPTRKRPGRSSPRSNRARGTRRSRSVTRRPTPTPQGT
ncbi:hypothetical protein ACF07T_41225 [Streptomyces sp. NPDC015184]|uniref:hypothetical protein n=1 Tax=Streptomyces sp. NPDC015184 TaxID=3364946 RepID=UPI0036FED3ED